MTDTEVANLVAKLSLDTSGFTSAASSFDTSGVQRSVQTAVDDIDIDIRHLNLAVEAEELAQTNAQLSQIQEIQDDALDFGKTILRVGIDAISTAKDIESNWAKVKTAVTVPPDIDPEAYFGNLKNEAYQISTEIPETISTVMQTMQAAGKAAVDAEDIADFTMAVLQLKEASGGALNESEIISYFGSFHDGTAEAYSDAERWGSAIVALQGQTSATEKDILSTATAIGTIGHLAQMSAEEIFGWGAIMADANGVSEKTFQKLVSIVDDGAGNVSDNLMSLLSDLNQLRLDDIANETTTYNDALKELGLDSRFYAEDIAKLTADTSGFSDILDVANTAFSENTALTDAAATATDTLDAKLLMAENSLTAIMAQLGDVLLPVIEKLGEVLLPLLQEATKFITDHPGLATTIVGIAGAFELVAVAAQFASIAMAMGSLGLAPWIGAVAIVGALVGVVVLLADAFAQCEPRVSATTEEIENMNSAIDTLTEVNGEFYIEPKFRNDVDAVDIFGEEFSEGTWVQWTNDWGMEGWIQATEEEAAALNARLMETQALVSETTTAFDSDTTSQLTENVEATEEAATSTTDIMSRLNEQLAAIDTTTAQFSDTMSGDFSASLEQMNTMLESEAFQQFAREPVDPEVGESWTAFGEAVSQASTGFSSIKDTLSEEEGLGSALDYLPDKTKNAETAFRHLDNYLTGGFSSAINQIILLLCQATVDEEGNINAGAGNTLYNALGEVSMTTKDIHEWTQKLGTLWTGSFTTSLLTMKLKLGEGTGALLEMDTTVQGLTSKFTLLTGEIYSAIDAWLTLIAIKNGASFGSGGGGNGKSNVEMRAGGGSVFAGRTYIVGEEGPELFSPSRSGYIIPNDDLNTAHDHSPSIVINFEGDVIGDERSIRDLITKAAKTAIRQEVRSAA